MDSCADLLAEGLPHSDIHGSKPARGSPWLFAACHVLHRLLMPRHPPNALIALDTHDEPNQWPSHHAQKQAILKPASYMPFSYSAFYNASERIGRGLGAGGIAAPEHPVRLG